MKKILDKKVDWNNFGALSKQYDAARKGYPKEVFAYLKELLPNKNAQVLDLGCGTGISTRQLKQHRFNVTGADKDAAMVRIAKKNGGQIRYVVAPAHKLPFGDAQFDLIAAFTSFHWFADKKSINEIKRVLRSGGVFFTVSKRPSRRKRFAQINHAYWVILKKYAGEGFDSAKDYYPRKILKENGFVKIKSKNFYFEEKYSLKGALTLQMSNSFWHLIPDQAKPMFCRDMTELYKYFFQKGGVIRDREAKIVVGYRR